jgi:hypothetical protein
VAGLAMSVVENAAIEIAAIITVTLEARITITYVTKSRGENRLFVEFGGRIASMTLYMALEVVACS